MEALRLREIVEAAVVRPAAGVELNRVAAFRQRGVEEVAIDRAVHGDFLGQSILARHRNGRHALRRTAERHGLAPAVLQHELVAIDGAEVERATGARTEGDFEIAPVVEHAGASRGSGYWIRQIRRAALNGERLRERDVVVATAIRP